MKKLPTLFRREFQNHHIIRIMPELSRPELGCVLAGEGVATEKIDARLLTVSSISATTRRRISVA